MKLSNNVSETAIRKSFENQGFNKPQARELWLCVANNVDITQIANIKYNPLLMRYIRVALQVNDDLSECYIDDQFEPNLLLDLLESYNKQGLIGPLNYSHFYSVANYPYREDIIDEIDKQSLN